MKNRYLGEYPVIGIRPTIDGRRGALGVRESLEEQTMNMAKSAAKLFEENLKYSNGEPVKVIIADTTIGRVAEAAACAAGPGRPAWSCPAPRSFPHSRSHQSKTAIYGT